MKMPRVLLQIVIEGRRPAGSPALPPQAQGHDGGIRRRAYSLQMEAEVEAYVGSPEAALRALQRASEADLVDVVWMDRCPLFGGLRGMPAFSALRAQVKQRADEILEAYRCC
jgi:hypothetical protein